MKYLFAFLFCLILHSSFAQLEYRTRVGVLSSNHRYEIEEMGEPDTDAMFGFSVGLCAEKAIGKKWAGSGEVYYSREGFEIPFDTTSLKVPIGFLNLNLGFSYAVVNGFRVRTGPELGHVLSAKWKINGLDGDVKEKYRKLSFGWNVEALYKLENIPIEVGIRYHLGLTDFSKDEIIQTGPLGERTGSLQIDEYKRNLQLNLYYKF